MAPPVTPISVGAAPKSVLSPTRAQAAAAAQQKEIHEIWAKIHDKVVQLAGGDPTKVPKGLAIEDVLSYVDRTQQAQKKKDEKYGWFKTVLNKTLLLIGNVGGIVAGAVSEVFAPASMCYGALTFVIQAWQGYEGIFQNLGELLERCVEFLERLDYYDGRMDARLTRVACQNLQLFVEICDHTIRLRKRRFKALAFMEMLFLKDDNISGLLGMMDKLNNKESLLVNAQTYKIVNDSAGDIKMILENQKEQKKEDDAKKWRKNIAKALGFPNATLGTDEEPIPTWQRALDARKNTLVKGTGKWLLDYESFVDWAQSPDPASSILVLEGNSGAGKTSLMVNALRELRKMSQAGATSRIVTAYYFADADKRKTDSDSTASMVESASRTLLWQIATAYEAMTKSMSQIAERTPDFDGSMGLWHQFFFNNKERQNADTTFFVFIDGIDSDVQTLLPLIEKLSDELDGRRTRVLLTATPHTTSEWLNELHILNENIIPVAKYNRRDIDLYINSRMDNMPMLKDADRNGISEWRADILKTLRKKCDGDYFRLDNSLSALANVHLVEDITDVLAQADKSRADQIDSAVRQLNNIRTTKELQEINEIILWVDSARQWITADMMEAVLAVKYQRKTSRQAAAPVPTPLKKRDTGFSATLKHRDSGPGLLKHRDTGLTLKHRDTGLSTASSSSHQSASDKTTLEPSTAALRISLLPFSQKLKDKYHPLFAVTDNNVVDWGSAEVKDHIPTKETASQDRLGISTSGPQVIQEAEISIVRHFLNNVCPADLYERFEFEQFFDGKIGARNKNFICVEPENAEIRIAMTCLTILTEGDLRKNEELRHYAMWWLLDHLSSVDLSAVAVELKAEVGPLLVRLFTEKQGVDSLLWTYDLNVSMKTWRESEDMYLKRTRSHWVYSDNGVEEVARWLKDSAVTKYLTEEPAKSFVSQIKGPNKNLHEIVLSHAATLMADHMFRRIEYTLRQFLTAARFLLEYLATVHPERLPAGSQRLSSASPEAKDLADLERDKFTVEQVQAIELWASEILDRSQETPVEASAWEFHCALALFQLCRGQPGASDIYRERARKAVELNPYNWHACHFTSKQTKISDDEAIKLLLRAKVAMEERAREDSTWLNDSANSMVLARIVLELGDRMWNLGQDLAEAARIHRESVLVNYVHWWEYVDLLVKYRKVGAWHEVIAFFEVVNSHPNIWAPYLDDLNAEFLLSTTVESTEILAKAADSTYRWDVIESFFKQAIGLARKQHQDDLVFYFSDGYAKTLQNSINNFQTQIIKVQEDALEGVRLHPSDEISQYAIDEVADSLALSYLDLAFKPNQPVGHVELYGTSIEKLIPETDDISDVWRYVTRTCSLIRYHRKRATNTTADSVWIQKIVRAVIELLSDDDEGNDDMAFGVLAKLLTAIEDVENLQITWMLRNKLQHEAYEKWEAWETRHGVAVPTAVATNGTNGSNGMDGVVTNGTNGDSALAPSPLLRVNTDSNALQKSPEPVSDLDYEEAPEKPSRFVECHGCGRGWTVLDVPLYSCADCVGTQQLCQQCHGLLLQNQLKGKSVKCKSEHARLTILAWDPSRAGTLPSGSVPLPAGAGNEPSWITMDEWKGRLRKAYLG